MPTEDDYKYRGGLSAKEVRELQAVCIENMTTKKIMCFSCHAIYLTTEKQGNRVCVCGNVQ